MGDDHINASYDITAGEMNIKIPKETPGEEFPDLDLLTKLLAPKCINKVSEKPLIEVMRDNDGNNENDDELNELFCDEQKPYETDSSNDFLIRELNSNINNEVNEVNEEQKFKPLIQEIFGGKINDENEAKKKYNLLVKGNIYNSKCFFSLSLNSNNLWF